MQISSPEDLEHVLGENVDNYIKPKYFTTALGEIFTPTLLGLNHAHTEDGGARFRLQRKLIARVFTANHFREFTRDVFHKHALRTIDAVLAQGGTCEMHKVASMFTLQTIFDIGLGLSLEDYDPQLGLKFVSTMDNIFLDVAARLIYKPYWRYLWWCMPSEYRLKRECRVLLDLIEGIIRDRLAEPPHQFDARSDILSMCVRKAREMEAKSPDGTSLMDPKTLLSCVTGLLFGGRDTISASLLYSFYKLAEYPAEQDKILAELKTININKLTYEDIKSLKYLDAFVWEVLRLHPVTPLSNRQAAEDDVLPDGTFIPAGTDISWSAYYIGRNNAKLWGDDQLSFRPERWLEMKKRPTMYEHPVFQAGLRMCPGMNMALLESKVFIAIMVSRFHVAMQPGEQVKDRPYKIALAMHMKDGLPLQFTPRTC
jgi:cytochrome P450